MNAQLINGNFTQLDITDPRGQSSLSIANPSAWGLSPGNQFFALALPPASMNGPASIAVYRVGLGRWPSVINTSAYADGTWGFSAEGTMFIITRLQNQPIQYSVEAYNLLSTTPSSGALRISETNIFGPAVGTSPCGDRLMYSRWLSLQPAQNAQGDFFRRTAFSQSPVVTDWDGISNYLSASIGPGGPTGYLVLLNGLKNRSNGKSQFPSLQCTP